MNGLLKLTTGLFGIGALFVLSLFFGAYFSVDSGERAVVLRGGKIIAVQDAGWHLKMPWLDTPVPISTRTDTKQFPDEPFYSKDQQSAHALLSVTYSVNPNAVDKVYTQFGSVEAMADRLLLPRVKKEFKEVMGRFNAATAIQERERMGVEVSKAITVESDLMTIHSVQVENIDFSDKYEGAIEERMLAEVGIATTEQNLAKEKKLAEIVTTQQQAIADGNFAVAKAKADGIRAMGEAEAAALEAKAKALRDNPELINLTKAERWQGVLPTHMIPTGAVPFLDVK
jgi:regulator of protease activity HflC (stomatin/prohibitin superfamily)